MASFICGLQMKCLIAILLLAFSFNANSGPFDSFIQTTFGNKNTVTFGSNGTPLVASSAPLGTPTVGAMGFTKTNEGVFLESLGKANVPGRTQQLPISAKLKLSAPIVGKALFRGAALLAGAGTLYQAGNELFDIWNNYGYKACPDGSIGMCYDYVTPGQQWRYFRSGTSDYSGSSFDSVCKQFKDAVLASMPGSVIVSPPVITGNPVYPTNPKVGDSASFPMVICNFSVSDKWPNGDLKHPSGISYSDTFVGLLEPYNEPTVKPVDLAKVMADSIARESGWPDSVTLALQKSLQNPQVQAEIASEIMADPSLKPVVTAQASTVGDPKVTTRTYTDTAGDPITETKTETITVTTTNNIINYNISTLTNTVNNTTGETKTQTEQTTQEEKEPVDVELCKKNPDILACKKLEFDTPDGEIPRNTVDLVYTEESFLNGGACPADVYVMAGGNQIKAIDWQSHCSNISTFVRPLVILLSSFIALLILIPGGREVTS